MTDANGSAALTPERLVTELRTAASPAISPDGTRIVYSLSQADGETKKNLSQLWTIYADGSDPQQVTSEGTTNSGPVWSPDGRSIAWVSRRSGDKPFAICTMKLEDGETSEVTRHAASPLALGWSPDGSRLAYTVPVDPDNPDELPEDPDAAPRVRAFRRLDFKQDNRGLLYDTRLQVMVVEMATGTVRQVTSALQDHTEPQWSPDGARLAVKVHNRNGMHSQLGIVDVAAAETSLVGTEDWQLGTWRWSPSGNHVLFDGNRDHSPQTDYHRFDAQSGEVAQLTDDLAFSPETGYPTLGHPAQPVWLDDSTALVHGLQAGASGLWTIDAFTGEITEIARFEAVHSGLSVDDARATVVQSHATPLSTGEIVSFDLETRRASVLTHLNDAVFAATPVGTFEKASVTQGSETIDYWLTFPPGFDAAKAYPVVLDIHGGPHGNFGYGFDKVAAVLANAGYLVVSPNPRGSGTYGRQFATAVHGDWGGEDWKDLQAALDDVLGRPYADAGRTAVTGYSYGGFMTSWAIGHTNRFKAAVCGAPVFDLESFYGTSDIGHVWGVHQWGAEWPEERDGILGQSPSAYIHNATTPTLIVHGEQDHRCPIGQGEQLFTALAKLGVETEFVRYPGGAHLMFHSGPNEHKIDYYDRVIDWFAERV